MPQISVIIPVYNVEKYLRICLDSVVNQSFRDIEIICINDGSTDDSLSILEEYAGKDSRITIIDQKNARQAASRNAGLRIAQGKYISFVDSDDWIHLEMYKILMALISDDLDLIVFDLRCIYEDKITTNKSLEKYLFLDFCGRTQIKERQIAKIPTVPWNKIYRRDIIEKYGISFPEGLIYEDNSFHWKYMIHVKNAYFLKEKFYNYRIRNDSTMSKAKSKLSRVDDHILVCLEIFEYIKKYDLVEKYQAAFVEFFEHCLGIVCACTNRLQESMKIAHQIWSKIDIRTDNDIIMALKNEDYDYLIKWINYSSYEKIFSLKKRYGKKVITICGIQFTRPLG